MKSTFQIRRSTAVLTFAIFALAAALAVTWAQGSRRIPVFLASAHAAAPDQMPAGGSFAPLVKRVMPAVVNISSSKVVKTGGAPNGMFDDPFFRQFFGGSMPRSMPRQEREHSLGSGVVVSSDGYILTNNHVVDGATEIKVSFSDKRTYPAKVVGADQPTDIAVLKVDRKALAALPLSDSATAQVGDVVLAIGNPFGLGGTVTMGIISAKGRAGLGIEQYEDFLQTDAAINPGNSGGALINSRGELVGINTAILSGGGGNQGIGFAIPVNLARNMMDQILKSGKVTRGFIGILPQEVTQDMRQAFGLPPNEGGIAIAQVEPNSPGAKAGLQVGDVITAIDGQKVDDVNSFRLKVANIAPGTRIGLKVFRDGSERDMPLTLATNTLAAARGGKPGENPGQGAPSGLEGVQVDNLTPQAIQQLQLPERTKGVLVTDVDEASAAAEAGLRPNDVIERVNHQQVTSVDELDRAVHQTPGKTGTLLLVRRGAISLFIVVPNK